MLGWALNLGFAGGVGTTPGLDWTNDELTLHYTIRELRLHYTQDESRMHYTQPDEDE